MGMEINADTPYPRPVKVEEVLIEREDAISVPWTEEMKSHPLSLHFGKWLGDFRIPQFDMNYPRLFNKFLQYHRRKYGG